MTGVQLPFEDTACPHEPAVPYSTLQFIGSRGEKRLGAYLAPGAPERF